MITFRSNYQKIFCLSFLVFCTFAYILFLINFYSKSYEIPDYYSYYSFSLKELKANDGFSSLFILISNELINYYSLIHFAMLALLALSIFIIILGFFKVVESIISRLIFTCYVFSLGFWWYFYGKLFYEFPFISFIFSIIFYLTLPFILDYKKFNTDFFKSHYFKVYIIFLLLGFCLSWKPHALITIICLVFFISKDTNLTKEFFLKFSTLFLIGYLLGNFNLLFYPEETIKGIRGAKSGIAILDIHSYFFDDYKKVWDHVNLLSFNTAILHWTSVIFFLFVFPFFTNITKKLLIFNCLIFLFFCFLMYKFLAGLTWQGFTFSLYFIILIAYAIAGAHLKKSKLIYIIVLLLSIQIHNNFFNYIPLQSHWDKKTDESINIINTHHGSILLDVQKLIASNGPNYYINLSVKRFYPNNPPDNILRRIDSSGWNEVFSKECKGSCNSTYVINIEPLEMLGVRSYESPKNKALIFTKNDHYIISYSTID